MGPARAVNPDPLSPEPVVARFLQHPVSLARGLVRLGRLQAHRLREAVRGRTSPPPTLTAMTLDADDVALAHRWLRDPDRPDAEALVGRYQDAFARWNGSTHAFAFLSGRAALSACLAALDLAPGDEVVVPGYTCVVVTNAVRFAGLRPVFADIELETFGLDAAALERALTPRTRAVIVQHLYGLVCRDYEACLDLCRRRGLRVIEDGAHAAGAIWKGRRVGNLGDLAFFSSEVSKPWTTVAGGLATTNDPALGRRLRDLHEAAPALDPAAVSRHLWNVPLLHYQRQHAQPWASALAELVLGEERIVSTTPQEVRGERPAGYGCKLPPALADLGLNQLAKLDRYNERRRATAGRWARWCNERGYPSGRVLPDSLPIYLRFPLLVPPAMKRDTRWGTGELGVEVGLWFETNLHPSPEKVPGCPCADEAVRRCVNLPTLLADP